MGIIYIIIGFLLYSFIVWWVCDGFNEEFRLIDYLTMICVFPVILCIGLTGSIIYIIDTVINKIYGTIQKIYGR